MIYVFKTHKIRKKLLNCYFLKKINTMDINNIQFYVINFTPKAKA